jgi:Purple acid Phosphatase, N-terminal domain
VRDIRSRKEYTKSFLLAGIFALFAIFFAVYSYAAEISEVKVTEVTDTSAIVEWKTDVNTDGTINYGLDTNFGVVRDPTFDLKNHALKITNLDPSTVYHFRVVSADPEGNKTTTGGFVFTTKGASNLTDKIIKDLSKIKDPKELEKIKDKVFDVAQDIIKPPTILGATKVVAEIDSAVITWTTDRESGSMVYLAPEGEYSAGSANPYSMTQGDPNDAVTKHEVAVKGLTPNTKYHFKVISEDSLGLAAETNDDTFNTKSLVPTVTGVTVTRIQENAATVNWSTSGVKAKGVVEYTNLRNNAKKTVGTPIFATKQSIRLADLEFGTKYSAVISATNETGESASSKPFTFVTVRDVVPPVISKVKNESTLFPGEDTKIQTIVIWQTDEPTYCQVFYMQGLVRDANNKGESLPKEQNPLADHTQVIVGFASATVYKFWIECEDESKNTATSEDFVLITPIKEKNIIDVILENFQGTFGWVNNIGK